MLVNVRCVLCPLPPHDLSPLRTWGWVGGWLILKRRLKTVCYHLVRADKETKEERGPC